MPWRRSKWREKNQLPPEEAFRKWLVRRVKLSRWVTLVRETDEDLAARIGIQPDVLRDARAELRQDQAARGLPQREVGGRRTFAPGELQEFFMNVPPAVKADVTAFCALRSVTNGTLLRSVVNLALTDRTKPEKIRNWTYRGVREPYSRKWPGILTTLPQGTLRALQDVANSRKTRPTAILRSILIDLLEGRVQRLKLVPTAEDMLSNPDLYLNKR